MDGWIHSYRIIPSRAVFIFNGGILQSRERESESFGGRRFRFVGRWYCFVIPGKHSYSLASTKRFPTLFHRHAPSLAYPPLPLPSPLPLRSLSHKYCGQYPIVPPKSQLTTKELWYDNNMILIIPSHQSNKTPHPSTRPPILPHKLETSHHTSLSSRGWVLPNHFLILDI